VQGNKTRPTTGKTKKYLCFSCRGEKEKKMLNPFGFLTHRYHKSLSSLLSHSTYFSFLFPPFIFREGGAGARQGNEKERKYIHV
jgi:hypothetical protein